MILFRDPHKALSYNRALDGVRGLAILLVVTNHTHLLHYGWIGVQLFFVLSGFLITSILLKEKEEPVPLRIKFRNFWIRRVMRIFPLYYLYLFFLIILWGITGDPGAQSANLPWLFTYTFNLSGLFQHNPANLMTSHLWTLSVEEQFYLLYPFLVLLCSRKQLRSAAIALILFSIAFRFFAGIFLKSHGLTDAGIGSFIYSSTFSHLDAFLLGGCIIIFNTYKLSSKRKYLIFLVLLVSVLVAGLFVYLDIRPGHFNFYDYITHLGYTPDFVKMQHHVWSYLILDLLFASLLLLLIRPGNSYLKLYLARVFRFTPLVAIGKVSYGMYIIQAGILYMVLSAAHYFSVYNKYIIFVIYLPVLYALAFIIYHVYEKKFLLMKERFR